jgi:hypothetical protein
MLAGGVDILAGWPLLASSMQVGIVSSCGAHLQQWPVGLGSRCGAHLQRWPSRTGQLIDVVTFAKLHLSSRVWAGAGGATRERPQLWVVGCGVGILEVYVTCSYVRNRIQLSRL